MLGGRWARTRARSTMTAAGRGSRGSPVRSLERSLPRTSRPESALPFRSAAAARRQVDRSQSSLRGEPPRGRRRPGSPPAIEAVGSSARGRRVEMAPGASTAGQRVPTLLPRLRSQRTREAEGPHVCAEGVSYALTSREHLSCLGSRSQEGSSGRRGRDERERTLVGDCDPPRGRVRHRPPPLPPDAGDAEDGRSTAPSWRS